MGKKADFAVELFCKGHNCSQAVLGAFCSDCKMDMDTALKLASSFGGGMGRLREVCGALSASFMIAGLIYGYSASEDKAAKAAHYKLIQTIAARFKEKMGSIICRNLIGASEKDKSYVPEDRTEKYYSLRPCKEIVREAALIVEELLEDGPERFMSDEQN